RLVRERLSPARAVSGKVDRDGGDLAIGEMDELRAPHRRRRADAVHEDDLDVHGIQHTKKRGRWMNHRPRWKPLRERSGDHFSQPTFSTGVTPKRSWPT